MEENYMATTRNGHEQKDMYNPETNTLDIRSNGLYASNVLTVGTHEYFKPRKDGTTHFAITPEIILHHAEMEEHQFEGITEEDRRQVWGMFADNDLQVNGRSSEGRSQVILGLCRVATEMRKANGESLFLQYYNQVVHFSGEHRMDDSVIENVLVPLIRSIIK